MKPLTRRSFIKWVIASGAAMVACAPVISQRGYVADPANEGAIKLARKWGYRVKGVPRDRAEIIVCHNNFHGRTTTIVGFSSEADYRDDFGPFAAGFKSIPFGDIDALAETMVDKQFALIELDKQSRGFRGDRAIGRFDRDFQ